MQTLKPHQRVAVDRIVRVLEAGPSAGAVGDLRGQAWMACGSGKTRVAVEVAHRVAPGGRVLVVVPRLALLTQTIRVWRHDGGRGGAMAAVCSLEAGDPVLAAEGVQVTTSPARLAWWWRELERQRRRPWTVFTTYASVERVAQAHALRVPGIPPLPVWDLVVADEAHHCAGRTTWALVNDQDAVPAVRRLAMTATPRIWSMEPYSPVPAEEAAAAAGDELQTPEMLAPLDAGAPAGAPPVSMDNPDLFGPVAYQLSLQQAQALGLVARWQIVAAEIDDPVLRRVVAEEGLYSERARGLYLAAQQAAVLKAAHQFGLRRVLTYHNRVAEAQAYAVTLAEQADRLRCGGQQVPECVWARALSAHDPGAERDAVLGRLAAGVDGPGGAAGLCVVASVRVLGEGIDVPEVDGAAFIDERCGVIDLVQSVGRALRLPRRRTGQGGGSGGGQDGLVAGGKVATIIVPIVHLDEGGGRDLYGRAWTPLVRLLQALRAHSEELVDELTRPRTAHRQDAAQRGVGDRKAVGGRLVRFLLGDRSAAQVAQFVRLRVKEGLAHDVARAVAAAERYHQRTGHLRVPRDHREGGVLLGVQCETWRIARRKGELDRELVDRLTWLGMEWEPRQRAWQATWVAIESYAKQRGHLLPRLEETVEVAGVMVPIGRIMTDCRRPAFAGRWSERVEALDGLRAPWRVPVGWDVAWQRRLVLLDQYLDGGGCLADLVRSGSRRFGGEDLGAWLAAQLQRWPALKPGQQAVLAARGLSVLASGVAAVGPRRSRDERFRALISAAQQYVAEVGPLTDARGRHIVDPAWQATVDGLQVRLLQRLNTARQRRSSLAASQLRLLAELGLPWARGEFAVRTSVSARADGGALEL